jgi:protein-tyrosine phosphatase
MTSTRHLNWDGCLNVRDLGGLPAAGGRVTRWGAVVRSDSPAALTPAGWTALRGHGIRTIVDLRMTTSVPPSRFPSRTARRGSTSSASRWTPSGAPRSGGGSGTTGWTARPCTTGRSWSRSRSGAPPRWPPWPTPGPAGSWVHCTIGRDRAGLVTLLLLALASVAPADIADDWELSNPRWNRCAPDPRHRPRRWPGGT